jgi:type III secretion system FlhB-like substrate exporter
MNHEEKKAVALRYTQDMPAPEIIAKARGILFDKMLQIAEKNNIQVYRDSDLVSVLNVLDTGSLVPPELYRAVAEVLAFCYAQRGKNITGDGR